MSSAGDKKYVITTNYESFDVLKKALDERKIQFSHIYAGCIEGSKDSYFTGFYTSEQIEQMRKLNFVTNIREMTVAHTCK